MRDAGWAGQAVSSGVGIGSSAPPMTVGGRVIADPAAAVMRYLEDHSGTVANYDLFQGSRDVVSLEIIRATRAPWMGSRISASQADWFIERSKSAPWGLVPADAELAMADPIEDGGLYDWAKELFEYFLTDRPRGVRVGKISKVLHLVRPRLYPILDTHLARFYRRPAREAALLLSHSRPGLARHKRLYWAAIRQDVVDNASALDELRNRLRTSSVPHAPAVAAEVGDVRLLDVIAWAADG